jgi:transcriptional regulator with XRE-family HTH domain
MGDYWVNDTMPLGLDMVGCGKKITQLLRAKGITDKKLSKMMNVSLQAISKWRHGYNLPDPENMYILSRILGVKVDDFLVPRRGEGVILEIEKSTSIENAAHLSRLFAYWKKLGSMKLSCLTTS